MNPLQQGLKLDMVKRGYIQKEVAIMNPLQQGLKQETVFVISFVMELQ